MPVVPGTLRSLAELELLVSLSPCPACGNRDTRALQPHGGLAGRPRRTIGVTATCARCATERLLEVEAEGDLTAVRVERFHLGGAAPATTITPAQFMAELDRVAPTVVSEVEQLEPAAWRKSGAQLDRVITCLVELLKFAPAGVDRIEPGADAAAQADLAARPERYQRAWIEAELTRYLELDRRRRVLLALGDGRAPRERRQRVLEPGVEDRQPVAEVVRPAVRLVVSLVVPGDRELDVE